MCFHFGLARTPRARSVASRRAVACGDWRNFISLLACRHLCTPIDRVLVTGRASRTQPRRPRREWIRPPILERKAYTPAVRFYRCTDRTGLFEAGISACQSPAAFLAATFLAGAFFDGAVLEGAFLAAVFTEAFFDAAFFEETFFDGIFDETFLVGDFDGDKATVFL